MCMWPVPEQRNKGKNQGNDTNINNHLGTNPVGVIPNLLVFHTSPCTIAIELVDLFRWLKFINVSNDDYWQSIKQDAKPWNEAFQLLNNEFPLH